ncbi:MAG: glycosyl transferase family 1 [Deltaproteobacteria bacterium RIFOXYD12_FULL_55_16]|nr:MAG: glycosyl transferase family 1 [Deltaproteobacteria bacterium RIFOXYD12_FULL_55_16]
MKIFVVGTRGIPDIPGGVEKHCQELYPLIVALGHEVLLATRRSYIVNPQAEWQGVRLIHIFCPRNKSLEAIVHTLAAILKARWLNPDIVHIHAVGPGLMAPLARLLGLRVVFTNHGPDYDRQKWGAVARMMLRLGEYLGGRFANEVIVISRVIAEIVTKRCGRSSHLIYNGVPLPIRSKATSFLERRGIRPGGYILAVARFVPEKGLHDLIAAFREVRGDYQLVIAGDADHETEYSRKLKEMAAVDKRVVLPGYVTGENLAQVFSHASLFVLPSYHEGLPIALLEAMSYGLSTLVSDIPANLQVELPPERFFRCGDVEELGAKMRTFLQQVLPASEQQELKRIIQENYDWRKIAEQTVVVYKNASSAA